MQKMTADHVWRRAVRGECSYEELASLKPDEGSVPEGEYYDYEALRGVMLRKLEGEVEDRYFKEWLYVMCILLDEQRYHAISWLFDGYAFEDVFPRNSVLELMARLQDLDSRLAHKDLVKYHRKGIKKIVYLRFEHCNRTADSAVYKAYIVDYFSRRFDIRMVDDAFFSYDAETSYCFLGATDSDGPTPPEYREEKELMKMFYDENGKKWTYDHSLEF